MCACVIWKGERERTIRERELCNLSILYGLVLFFSPSGPPAARRHTSLKQGQKKLSGEREKKNSETLPRPESREEWVWQNEGDREREHAKELYLTTTQKTQRLFWLSPKGTDNNSPRESTKTHIRWSESRYRRGNTSGRGHRENASQVSVQVNWGDSTDR